jgi:hypothetical protein
MGIPNLTVTELGSMTYLLLKLNLIFVMALEVNIERFKTTILLHNIHYKERLWLVLLLVVVTDSALQYMTIG